MNIIFFSSSMDTIDEWKERHNIECFSSCHDMDSLNEQIEETQDYILIADYDTVANDINKMITSNTLPENMIVLEKAPEVVTGKMLISHHVKAYGNSRMLTIHYLQMIQTVLDGKVWTYPELTAALSTSKTKDTLNQESIELLENRLTTKEIEVVKLVINGYTNNAIASALDITTRTVKAHIGSIFNKLHVNDRLSLVLLLK